MDRLDTAIGPAEPPPATDPFELIIWENVAYLVDDDRRRTAFTSLACRVGLKPELILAARDEELLAIVAGMRPVERVQRLRDTAALTLEHLPGPDRVAMLRALTITQAKKLLKRFPGIGDPSAETILLFCGTHRILGLESNAVRVITRLGFVEDQPDYTKTYRLIQEALSEQLPRDYAGLIEPANFCAPTARPYVAATHRPAIYAPRITVSTQSHLRGLAGRDHVPR